MIEKRTELSRLYYVTLQGFLKQEPGTSMEPARELGRRAMSIGLETLDLARMHEIALTSLVLPSYSASTNDGLLGRAGKFFAEAITPIEQTHRGAKEANVHLNVMIRALGSRTEDLAASVAELKLEIARRSELEESLRISEQTSTKRLKNSLLMQEELRHLSQQLLSAQEEERRKISRELHDVITQTLTGINMRLAALASESSVNSEELQEKIAGTQRLVEKSVEIVHRFARDLRPTVLDDIGLISALQALLKDFMEETGIRVSLKAFAGIDQLDGTRRTMLYRVAEEALKNVGRHSQASRAEVSFSDLKGNVQMEIKDDGKGFAVEGNVPAMKTSRLGLIGMRERLEMVGGTFCIESELGKGTTVRVVIPTCDQDVSDEAE